MKKNREDEEYYEERKGNGFVIFLCILCLIIIGGGAFGGFYFYKTNISTSKSQEKVYVNVGDVTVNLTDDSGKKYVKAEIYVGYNKGDSKAKKQLAKDKQLSVVQDALSFDLKNKNSDYFKGDYEDQLKTELIDCVNKQVQNFKITDIKIVNLIVQ